MLSEQDQERFMRHWTAAQPAVENYVHALIRNPSDAKDVLQETALVLFRRFAEYDEQRPFIGWALGVTRLQSLSYFRDQNRCPVIFDGTVLDQFTEQWSALSSETSDRALTLKACIERLASRARQLVNLRYFEDLNAEEIAERLGTNGPAVRVALQRIRAQLQICVSQSPNLDPSTP